MSTPLTHRRSLRALAHASIEHGLRHYEPVGVSLQAWPERLRQPCSTFVTLCLGDQLRGCVGALESARPLARDVAVNAFAAAFRDPRFTPVTAIEFPDIELHVSLLSPIEPLEARSEADLIRQLRPGVDGLIFEEGDRCGTFLPVVWRSLPSAGDFLAQLKAKTGLPPDYWSETLRAYRYTTEEF
ncbi:MAG: AmmeMemoRadiSam system protein A [Gammaproteobacteria bacterium]|nr:AmmeMemoRadiSam system protein A [Gammaproteobacteria bacterium]